MIFTVIGCTQTETTDGQGSDEEVVGKSLEPGTYTAVANGYNGPVEVETVVDEDSIKSVKILSHYETYGVWQVIDRVPESIVAEQSIEVDTVSGATFAGLAVKAAVKDCLEQANGDLAQWSIKKEPEPAKEESYTADVIVIGAGGSGLAAAVSAHQNGASVIVVEKLGMVGGSTIFSGGAFNAADPERAKKIEMTESNDRALSELLEKEPYNDHEKELQETITKQYEEHLNSGNTFLFDSPELHILQTYNGGDYAGNLELISIMANNGLTALEWIQNLGVKWNDELGMATGAIWQRSHYGVKDEYPDGFSSVFGYVDYIESNDDIEIQFDTKAEELILEDNQVVGVKAMNGINPVTYTANNGVVIATGGFGANIEMREEYNTQWASLDSSIGCSNQSVAATGDGIVMAESIGAQLIDMGLIQLHPNGEVGTGMMMGQPHTSGLNRIFINNDGNRFVAEDSRRDVLVEAIYDQPDGTMWIVADGTRYPEGDIDIGNAVELGKTMKADTIEELAKLIEVDPTNLQNAIDEYNNIVDGAVDKLGLSTYGVKLGNAPFYAAKRLPTVHHTMGGLKIDGECRVMGEDDKPISGLYAAGEVTGNIHGANRLGGNAIVDIAVFGKIAGESAAAKK